MLKIHMGPHPRDDHRAPGPIVARIVDKRELHRHIKAAHYVGVVVGFADLLAAVVETAIAQDESQAAQG
jgi:hypothetical protein